MRKTLRISLIVVALGALLFLLLVASIFLVQPERYRAYLEQTLVQNARNAGVMLSIGGAEFSPRSYTAHNLKIGIPRKFLFFDVDSIELRPEYMTLFSLSPRVQMNAKLYEGTISALAQYALRKGDGSGTISVKDLKVSEHPQFAGLGIRDGNLSADGNDLQFDQNGLRSGALSLTLSNVEKPQVSTFPLRSFGLPLDLQLPAFSALNLVVRTSVHRPEVEISEINLQSSLGALHARGKLTLAPNGQPASWLIDGTAELSADGQTALGQYLPLLSGGSIDENTQRFRILMKGSPQMPTLRLTRY